jgi:hypothetical protein
MSVKLYPWCLRWHSHWSLLRGHTHPRGYGISPGRAHYSGRMLHTVYHLHPLLHQVLPLSGVHHLSLLLLRPHHLLGLGLGRLGLVLLQLVVHHLKTAGGTPIRCHGHVRSRGRNVSSQWRDVHSWERLRLLDMRRNWRHHLLLHCHWHASDWRRLLKTSTQHVCKSGFGLLVGPIRDHLTASRWHALLLCNELLLGNHWAHLHLRLTKHLLLLLLLLRNAHLSPKRRAGDSHDGPVGVHMLLFPLHLQTLQVL